MYPIATAVTVVMLFFLAAASCASSGSDAAPATTFTGIALERLDDGTRLTSDSLTGGPLVVNLWASWCAPCRAEMPSFEKVHQSLGDRVRIIGVTDDADLGSARQAAAASGATYELVADPNSDVQRRFAITGLPATAFLDAHGSMLELHQGALDEAALHAAMERWYGKAS